MRLVNKKLPKDVYLEGVEAFKKGRLNNPYKVYTYYWKEWDRGFNSGYFENLALAS
jgi:hypothetical protein